jgi:hypothetical protein
MVRVAAPEPAGHYVLRLVAVQELARWYGEPPLAVDCAVSVTG